MRRRVVRPSFAQARRSWISSTRLKRDSAFDEFGRNPITPALRRDGPPSFGGEEAAECGLRVRGAQTLGEVHCLGVDGTHDCLAMRLPE